MQGARFLTYGYIVSTVIGILAGSLFGSMAGWLTMWLGGGIFGLTMALVWHLDTEGVNCRLDPLRQNAHREAHP